MMAYGYHSVQWCFIMIYMVDAQYSGVFKRKKSKKLVLANNFHHIHHDNLPDVYRILEYVNIV